MAQNCEASEGESEKRKRAGVRDTGHKPRRDLEHVTVRARVPGPCVGAGQHPETVERLSVKGRAAGKAGAGDVTQRHEDRCPAPLKPDVVSAAGANVDTIARAETRRPGDSAVVPVRSSRQPGTHSGRVGAQRITRVYGARRRQSGQVNGAASSCDDVRPSVKNCSGPAVSIGGHATAVQLSGTAATACA